jgi:co-chaperonin GroES (HSP10)
MKPVGGSYLVSRITTKEKNENGAFAQSSPLPTMSSEGASMERALMKGEVMGIPELTDKSDKHVCKTGDKIMFSGGEPITVDDKEYMLVSRWDIKLVL